jgi:hypothetical protein
MLGSILSYEYSDKTAPPIPNITQMAPTIARSRELTGSEAVKAFAEYIVGKTSKYIVANLG